MTGSSLRSGLAVLAVGCVISLGAAGCGSGAVTGPDETESDPIVFALPVGDESALAAASDAERQVYSALREGCEEGQAALDEHWRELASERDVLLYQAAVEACAGHEAEADQLIEAAEQVSGGESGLRQAHLTCAVFRASRGVVDRVDPRSVTCPGGAAPTWPPDQRAVVDRRDPRALVDPTDPTSTSTTATTAGSSTTSSSTGPSTSVGPTTSAVPTTQAPTGPTLPAQQGDATTG